jgi:hypothetical protein
LDEVVESCHDTDLVYRRIMEKTKENLFAVAKRYGMNERGCLLHLKGKGVKMPFDPANWHAYMFALTGHVACLVCNGPQTTRKELAGIFGSPAGTCCIDTPSHFYQIATADLLVAVGIAFDFEDGLRKAVWDLDKQNEWNKLQEELGGQLDPR